MKRAKKDKTSRVATEIISGLKELNACLARGGDIRKEFRTTRVYLRGGRIIREVEHLME